MCVPDFEYELQRGLHLQMIAIVHLLDWPYTSYYLNTTVGYTLCPTHSDYPRELAQSKYELHKVYTILVFTFKVIVS